VRGFYAFGLTILSALAFACGSSSRTVATMGTGGTGGSTAGGTGGDGAGGDATSGTGGSVESGGSSGTAGKGGTAGDGSGGTGGDPVGSSSLSLDGIPIYTRVQRLTNSQWEHAVTDILRFSAAANLSQAFLEPVAGLTEFDNNERVLYVDGLTAVDFETGAEAAAALATGSPAALEALYPGTDAEGFVQSLGRRAFRRPLTAEEQTKYEDVFALGEELYGAGFANGASLVIRALLVSPHFLYRTELGAAGEPLDGYEAASKLSFWLLDTTPSDALLDAAAAGDLDDANGLEAVARTMLEAPAAIEVMRDFHAQLLHVARYQQITKVDVPEYSEALNAELAQASTSFFDHLFTQDLGLRELLTSSEAYVGPGLAPLYGMEPPASGLELVSLGPSRTGYFMQVPFLLLNGLNRQPDTIHRGLVIHHDVLCADPGVVQAGIPPIPALPEGQTNREVVTELTSGCGGVCHGELLNPLGFAFENFDGMGVERTLDNGKPVDTSGQFPFDDGVHEFANAIELMQILAGNAQAHQCYSKHVAGYALQRDIIESDRPLLESLGEVSAGDSLKELAVSLVRDPAFRLRQEGTP
jgi:hypothetical protein